MKSNKITSTLVLFKKELSHYFNSPIAYIFIGVFLVINNWIFFSSFFLSGQAMMRNFFSFLPWTFLFLAPAITMRLWSEERKSGTIELLLTLPLTKAQIVAAKFLSAFVFLIINLILSFSVPLTLHFLGKPDYGPIIGGYLGSLFLGSSYLALGLWVSSLTKNQIIAFISSIALCFLIFIAGVDFVVNGAPTFLRPILNFIGFGVHFENIARGVVDTRDVIYYVTFTAFFLWLNTKALERN